MMVGGSENRSDIARQADHDAAIRTHSRQADEFARRYDQYGQDPFASCFAYSRWCLDRWLEELLPEPSRHRRLLDLGCGTGFQLAQLRDRGFSGVGLDGSDRMLWHARRTQADAPLCRADVTRLPFAAASFDTVLCVEVLRYLPSAKDCAREIARVLAPGGVCVVTAAPRWNLNGYWLGNRLATAFALPGFTRLRQYFTGRRQLERVFLSAGFSRVEVHGVYLGPINWVERLAPPLLPGLLKAWSRWDRALADRTPLRSFANMFVVRAERASEASR